MKRWNSSALLVWMAAGLALAISGCKAPSATETTSSSDSSSSGATFASGTKAVKIITSSNTLTGSFTLPSTLPTATPIPTVYPGSDGTTKYHPGVSASRYFDVDGTTEISKPSWLLDVQLGVTGVLTTATCAKFGNSGASGLDVADFYRVSEADCSDVGVHDGSGGPSDPVFARIVLSRNTSVIGTAENLLIQIEYQASGLHLNTDGTGSDPESNADQLWKVYWNSTLATSSSPKPFSVFVPPVYSACLQSGTGNTGFPGSCVVGSTYRGSPVQVRQLLIPLSALPTASVIQISRVRSRVSATALADDYVNDFCATNTPLCLGIVIRSITIMRI